ncbi:MAG: hypothetical protein Q7S53_05685 [bacterium]|nr:hypothetical protein [bacterium]
MKIWNLRIRKEDKGIFDRIKSGEKTIETRPLNAPDSKKDYSQIASGDKLIFSCDGEKLYKNVEAVRIYKDFEQYLDTEDLENILGKGMTKEVARDIHYGFPGCKERLEKYGIIAMDMEQK